MHVRFLTQVAGPVFGKKPLALVIAERGGFKYLEMGPTPDRWSLSWVRNIPRTNSIVGPVDSSSLHGNIRHSFHRTSTSALCGTKKLIQYKRGKTLVFYSSHQNRTSDFGHHKWVPMPLCSPGRQEFALLHKSQFERLRLHILSQYEPMTKEDLRLELEDLMFMSSVIPISMPILRCGALYLGHEVQNFIIVAVDRLFSKNSVPDCIQMSNDSWCLLMDNNCHDVGVPGCGIGGHGVVVGRFGSYSRTTPMTMNHLGVLDATFPNDGLNRRCTDHEGKFYMCSKRQSEMASGSMCQVGKPTKHFYFNEQTMNTSLVNFAQPILNFIANEAIQHRDTHGQIQMGLIKNAVKKIVGETISSMDIAPHIILTGWRYSSQLDSDIPFSNSEHIENDECLLEYAKMVFDFIDDSADITLKQYFARMRKMFPERTTISSRPMLQCPTTCVWMHTRSSFVFESKQYFAMSESRCCWDLGNYFPSETVPQVAGTFLAGISAHVTTCALWTHITKNFATLISPEPGSLRAWGSNPKKRK